MMTKKRLSFVYLSFQGLRMNICRLTFVESDFVDVMELVLFLVRAVDYSYSPLAYLNIEE